MVSERFKCRYHFAWELHTLTAIYGCEHFLVPVPFDYLGRRSSPDLTIRRIQHLG